MSSERFVEAEKSENHVRPCFLQPVIGRAEIFRAMAKADLVTRDGKVSENEIVIGVLRVDERFEPARVLKSVGQRISDKSYMVGGFDFDLAGQICGVGSD